MNEPASPYPVRSGSCVRPAGAGSDRAGLEGPFLRHQSQPLLRGHGASLCPARQPLLARAVRRRFHSATAQAVGRGAAAGGWNRYHESRKPRYRHRRGAHTRGAPLRSAATRPEGPPLSSSMCGRGRNRRLPRRVRSAPCPNWAPARTAGRVRRVGTTESERPQRQSSTPGSGPGIQGSSDFCGSVSSPAGTREFPSTGAAS
jgi:hypothetical protein